MTAATTLQLEGIDVRTEPFAYFVARRAFPAEVSDVLLDWLEREPCWELVEEQFYEQYEFSLGDVHPPPSCAFLLDAEFTEAVRATMARLFSATLAAQVDCTVHKLLPGQRIRIHNDYIPGRETHRLIVQLNRGWRAEQGGLLMLFNSPDAADVHRVILPAHGSAVGFAISPDSHHAVSTTHAGARFTLVFSFYAPDRG